MAPVFACHFLVLETVIGWCVRKPIPRALIGRSRTQLLYNMLRRTSFGTQLHALNTHDNGHRGSCSQQVGHAIASRP